MADLALGKAAAPTSGRLRRRDRRWLRPALIAFGPIVLVLIGAYIYLAGGRYIATDHAYVRADITQTTTDVAGRTIAIAVHENEPVKAGQVLFRLDDEPYRYALERAEAQL